MFCLELQVFKVDCGLILSYHDSYYTLFIPFIFDCKRYIICILMQITCKNESLYYTAYEWINKEIWYSSNTTYYLKSHLFLFHSVFDNSTKYKIWKIHVVPLTMNSILLARTNSVYAKLISLVQIPDGRTDGRTTRKHKNKFLQFSVVVR